MNLTTSVHEGVFEIYPNFTVDPDRLWDFATTSNGLGMSADELADTNINFYHRIIIGTPRGRASNPASPLGIVKRRNQRNGLEPSTINVRIGVNRKSTPQRLERTMVHELVHVRQIRRQEHSIKAGYATITGLSEAGFIAGSALTYLDSHSFALAAGVGIYAAVGGIGLGYSIAPHEREARRIARQAEYMGIITMACSLE